MQITFEQDGHTRSLFVYAEDSQVTSHSHAYGVTHFCAGTCVLVHQCSLCQTESTQNSISRCWGWASMTSFHLWNLCTCDLRMWYLYIFVFQLCENLTHDFKREGWLSKTGPRVADAFRRRWFTLDRRKLRYYEDPLVCDCQLHCYSLYVKFRLRWQIYYLFRYFYLGCFSQRRDLYRHQG